MDEFNHVNQSERNDINLQEIEEEQLPTQNCNTETQGIPRFNSTIEFNDFIEKFKIQSYHNEWKRRNRYYVFNEITQESILNSTIYKPVQNNPAKNEFEPLSKGLEAFNCNDFVTAALYFDETIRIGHGGVDLWAIFSTALLKIKQYDRAIWATKQILHLRPDDINRYMVLCQIYTKYKCKYQVCQSAFNWLKYNELYSHLIPLDFTMYDKNSSDLDNNQFSSVEDFFFKASQLNLMSPDSSLQNVLQRLYYGCGEFYKVMSCLCTKIIFSDTISTAEIRTLGYCTFLNNYPYAAFDIFCTLSASATRMIYLDLGFVYMYLGHYTLAIVYFKEVLSSEDLIEEFQIQGNTRKDEFDLCLRWYWECVKL